jgi:hypothetical protein
MRRFNRLGLPPYEKLAAGRKVAHGHLPWRYSAGLPHAFSVQSIGKPSSQRVALG